MQKNGFVIKNVLKSDFKQQQKKKHITFPVLL